MQKGFHRGTQRKKDMKLTNLNQCVKLDLPRNLAECVGERALLDLSFDSVQNVQWELSEKALMISGPLRPQMLLTLLTYCYSSGTYGSQDIVQAIRQKPRVRYICAHNFPDWQTLRKFRRHSRP